MSPQQMGIVFSRNDWLLYWGSSTHRLDFHPRDYKTHLKRRCEYSELLAWTAQQAMQAPHPSRHESLPKKPGAKTRA